MGIKQKRLTNPKPKLNWENLLNHRCPKCSFDCEIVYDNESHIESNPNDDMLMCMNRKCDFIISKNKCLEICDNLEQQNRLSSMEGFGFE